MVKTTKRAAPPGALVIEPLPVTRSQCFAILQALGLDYVEGVFFDGTELAIEIGRVFGDRVRIDLQKGN